MRPVVEKKGFELRHAIYILIILICIIAIVIAVYNIQYFKDEKIGVILGISKEENDEEIKALQRDFLNIFTNDINIIEQYNERINKIKDNQEVVVIASDIQEQTKNYTLNLKIPYININTNVIISGVPQSININFPSPSKKKDCTSSLKSSSYIQSLKTSHTLTKEHECSPILKNKMKGIGKFLSKKIELNKFIKEINLPEKYTGILIENGFDDLDVLINQTKKGLALSYQNLGEIGITLPAHRAKILIHLEELADNFDFFLENNIIYSNKIPEEKSGSLYEFLLKINLDEYFQNFVESGFYSAELLYTQMASKNPVTEEMLKNDLGVDKLGHLQRIIISLKEESMKYLENLVKKSNKDNRSIIYEENPYYNSCQACFVF